MIRVWADKLADQASLSRQISDVLTDDSKTDGTNSIYSQNIVINEVRVRKVDVPINNFDEPLKIRRVANISAIGKYVGA